ncbi:DNA primase small subunit [Cryptosporidium felis]|nr:DNA primase small subunit [Cryptosporidium felis]
MESVNSEQCSPLPDDTFIDKNDLKFFYNKIYPFGTLGKWLAYSVGSGKDHARQSLIQNREFSMTLKSEIDQDEIYLRWQNYKSIDQLKQELVNRNPHKFDIGAIYSIPISEKEISPFGFRPVQRELVFDIDMNDYDDIRTCCQEKTICEKCWLFITIAIRLIDTSLREDFGFKHILWLYSGRRGVHCWVCDTKARLLPSEARTAIIDYLTLITGNENKKKKVNLKVSGAYYQSGAKTHPFIDRCFAICMQYFEKILQSQKLFEHDSKHIAKVLNHLSDDTKIHQIVENWVTKNRVFSSQEFWDFFSNTVQESQDKSHTLLLMEIVFTYSYPRLDINVSKDLGHLLKAPFCIHHSTGRLCIPIDTRNLLKFNPKMVPTLTNIRKEYDSLNKKDPNSSLIPSSINRYVQFMDDFVDNLLRDVKLEQQEYSTMLQLLKQAPEKSGQNNLNALNGLIN